MSEKGKRKKGTASKSITLTYDQLVFLHEKANASAWVREAIEQAKRIEEEGLVVVDLKGEGRGSRLVKEGLRPAMHESWAKVVKLVFDVDEARKEAGDNKEAFERFQMSAYKIADALRKILKGDREQSP